MNDYEYLLSPLDKIKGIGNKTIQLFFKKRLKLYLICCGICLFQILKHQELQNLKI